MARRITPNQYFGNEPQNTVNYIPLIIFGICIVAIVVIALAYSKK